MDGFEVVGLRLDLVIVALVTGGLVAIALVLFGVGWLVGMVSRYWDGYGWTLTGVFFAILAAITGVVWACLLIPFQQLYHHWYSTSGTVESVTNIFEGGSGEISPGYVVELDSVDKPLLFGDPRILRAAGEKVDVTCSVEWVPSGVDRLNCWIAG